MAAQWPRFAHHTNPARDEDFRSGGDVAEGVDYAVHQLLDQEAVFALAHDADHWLGARRTNDETAVTIETPLRLTDGGANLGGFERLAAAIAHVPQHLRQRIEAVANLRYRLVLLFEHGQHLQRGHKAVAGGGVIRQDDVPGRLAPDIVAVLAHMLEHIAVADRGARERKADAVEIALEAEVRHHGGDDAGLGEVAIVLEARRDDGQELVAVDDAAALICDDDAIGVAVEGDADVGAHLLDLGAQGGRLGRSALAIDVEAVGLDPDRHHVGAELPQRLGNYLIGRAVGAVDDDAQPVEAHGARQCALGELDITPGGNLDALGATKVGGFGELLAEVGVDQRFDMAFDLVGKFVAVRSEQLDAVVVEGIVRGRDHDAEIATQRAGQHG